jgi:hypothetical protein
MNLKNKMEEKNSIGAKELSSVNANKNHQIRRIDLGILK